MKTPTSRDFQIIEDPVQPKIIPIIAPGDNKLIIPGLPTFLVCTMYCGEPDFPYCEEMIRTQRSVNVKHIVIKDRPEMEAHNAVYQAFNDDDPTWYRVKLDADVVLMSDNVFSAVAADLKIRTNADGLNPHVNDFMTDTEINAGITFYKPNVRFKVQTNPLKCDRDVVSPRYHISTVQMMGYHMHHANELTAFRYGLHRGLKGQTNVRDLVQKAYDKHQDRIRLMALKGFEAGLSDPRFAVWHQTGKGVPDKHNYGDAEFKELFNAALASFYKTS